MYIYIHIYIYIYIYNKKAKHGIPPMIDRLLLLLLPVSLQTLLSPLLLLLLPLLKACDREMETSSAASIIPCRRQSVGVNIICIF